MSRSIFTGSIGLRRGLRLAVISATAGFASARPSHGAAVSASAVPGTLSQGVVRASLAGGSYAAEGNQLGDWPLTTGSFGGTAFGVSLSNPDFNGNSFGGTPNTMIAFGNGGGVTVRFSAPVRDAPGQKDFGVFTAQALVASGALFNGNMEAAVLISADNVTWRTLAGEVVESPSTYTATGHRLNAPTVAYDYGTSATAWGYGSPGTSPANLAGLQVADFASPMPDDGLVNGAGTDAQRAALRTDTSPSNYDALFGTSGGGNWFDLAGSGLAEISYLRLNGVNVPASGGVRLDAVFANAASVPEPTGFMVVGTVAAVLLLRRRR
jgi:hypothetical protein